MTRNKYRSRATKENKTIALERISILFKLARKIFDREPELAQHYVDSARKIGMRYKVRIPVEFRRMICKHCKSYIVPGKNCIVRIKPARETHLVVTCLLCQKHMRIPLKEKNVGRSEMALREQNRKAVEKPTVEPTNSGFARDLFRGVKTTDFKIKRTFRFRNLFSSYAC